MDADNINSSLKISVVDWQINKDELSKIRRTVFIEEQNVPEDMEWDVYDEVSTHFLVTINDEAVATARLTPSAQIGRMAVLSECRNQGIGSRLLQFVLQTATDKKLSPLNLHAQVTAISFYEKQGFIVYGKKFYEAGIAHREMRLTLLDSTE